MKKEVRERHSLKIIALIFSIFLWFFVISSEPVELERTLNLTYSLPDEMAISNMAPREVKVKLKGSKAFIKTVLRDGDDFKIDLEKYKTNNPKRYFINIHPADLSLPFGIEVLSITPHEFKLEVDRKVEMDVPVLLQVKNKLPSGRLLDSIDIDPKSLVVEGPVDAMGRLSRLKTLPFDLSQLERDEFETVISLEEVDRRIIFKNGKPLRIKVRTRLDAQATRASGLFGRLKKRTKEQMNATEEKVNQE